MSLFFKKQSYKNYSIDELVKQAQMHDIQALEELIKREQKNVYATLYYLNQDREEIFDETQDVLLKMCRNLKNLKNPKAFKSWLNQIIMHYYYDVIRKKNRLPQMVQVEKLNNDDETYNVCDVLLIDKKKKPDETSLLKELDAIITNAISNLPEQLKIVTVLREFQGLSYEEIATVTNTNTGTVKSRISRARRKLQEMLNDYIK